jgi:ribosome maturation factor RimP
MALRLDEIRAAAARVAASHGLDVVDVELAGSGRDRLLRVFLEKDAEGRAQLETELAPAAGSDGAERRSAGQVEGRMGTENSLRLSGVTHEDLAAFSRDFGTLLDVEDLVPGAAYTLEASSPGLDRKLTRPEDFERFLGCLVKVRTFEPVGNNRHWQGRLIAGAETPSAAGKPTGAGRTITLDLSAGKLAAAGKGRKRRPAAGTVEIAFANIEKANLVPEI